MFVLTFNCRSSAWCCLSLSESNALKFRKKQLSILPEFFVSIFSVRQAFTFSQDFRSLVLKSPVLLWGHRLVVVAVESRRLKSTNCEKASRVVTSAVTIRETANATNLNKCSWRYAAILHFILVHHTFSLLLSYKRSRVFVRLLYIHCLLIYHDRICKNQDAVNAVLYLFQFLIQFIHIF